MRPDRDPSRSRRAALAASLLLCLAASACAPSPRGEAGERGGAGSRPIEPDPAQVRTAVLPAASLVPEAPEWVRAELWGPAPPKRVRPRVDGQRVFSGRLVFSPVVDEVDANTPLTYLESREGWVFVRTPAGVTGWLPPGAALLLDGERAAAGGEGAASADYTLAPGFWRIDAPAGPIRSARLQRGEPGVVYLSVAGRLRGARVVRASADRGLAVLVDAPEATAARLDVRDHELDWLALGPRGLWVQLGSAPSFTLLRQDESELVIALHPTVRSVRRLEKADRTIIRFEIEGEVRVATRADDGRIVAVLPGSVWAGGPAALPEGIALEALTGPADHAFTPFGPGLVPSGPGGPMAPPQGPGGMTPPPGAPRVEVPPAPTGGPHGLRALVETRRAYAIQRRDDGFDLVLYRPGLDGKTVVLDPGHGGSETGAIGYNGLAEKDSNLAIALRVAALLKERGANAVLTRGGDHPAAPADELAKWPTPTEKLRADLDARSELANSLPADVFVSIHGNGGPAGDAGTETYFTTVNLNGERSRHLAGLLQAATVEALGTVDRGVKNRGFNVVRYTDAPAALLETAFLTNAREADLLADPAVRERLAQAIAGAIEDFFRER